MHIIATSHRFSALALGIAGVLALGQAQASGFQLQAKTASRTSAAAMAGAAVASDDASRSSPTTRRRWRNLDKNTVQADVTAIDLSSEFAGGGHRRRSARPLTGGNGGDAGDVDRGAGLAAVFPMHGALEGLTFGAMRRRAVRPEDRIRRRLGGPLQRGRIRPRRSST